MTTSVVTNLVFRGFFEKQKLTGPNFIDWLDSQLGLYHSGGLVRSYLEAAKFPPAPVPISMSAVSMLPPEAFALSLPWAVKRSKEIAGIMLMTMEPEIQLDLENLSAYEMLQELKTLFVQKAYQGLPFRNPAPLVLCFAAKVQPASIGIKKQNPIKLRVKIKGRENNLSLYGLIPKPKIPPSTKRGKNNYGLSVCHQCWVIHVIGRGKRNCPQNLAKLLKNMKLSQGASGSVSRLYDDGYVNRFMDNAISVSRNKLVYFSVVPRDRYFEIETFCSNPLCNCQFYGLLQKCLSHACLCRGKMARKPYTHQVERAKDLLGLIHNDVYGPFKVTSRQGANYFVTFTDEFSRYGYVYLLKHKHEVFETFKVFQKEIKNQLGKTIKSLHSDREGEYMSQEFLDHLKDHRIIAHRTPPYTPQHNGVSERRNGTLLDMVRSMMSQTTLPKSFWDYAIEMPATCLKWIPTKTGLKRHHRTLAHIYEEAWHLSNIDEPQSDIIPIRRSTRTRHAPDHIRAIRILIAIAAYYDYEIWQMDVKTAFLNRHLTKKRYMEQPEGFVNQKFPNRVCKLKRSIYGLKQASSHVDILKASGSNVTFLILYVEDILIMGNNIPMLQDVKSYLRRCFSMNDLGEATYILGIKIYIDRSWRLIGLCQSAYIEKILKRFHMENSKRGIIPMQEKLRLSKSQGATTPAELKRVQNVPYASAVGSIMYISVMLLVWKSTKQSIFVTSSAEAEYIAAYDASREVRTLTIVRKLESLKVLVDPIHFRAKVHYLHEVIEYDDIKLEKVHTYDNLVDPFTKALAFLKHSEHTRNIEMLPASSLM
ncbi:retrotransposon protein, putative, ty1-copia subclass [Tanacetum coccineum]